MGDESVEVNKDLLKIKDIIKKPIKSRPYKEEVDEIVVQLGDLHKKVDEIRNDLMSKRESPRKLKRKKEIIFLLKEKTKLTASELSKLIDLSRTRASEYLNEMEKEGIVEGKKDGRKKFYRLSV